MISKVLTGAEKSKAQLFIFPAATLPAAGMRPAERSPAGDPSGAADPALAERVRQLEAQLARERIEAHEAGRRFGEQQARSELQPVLERLQGSITDVMALRPELRRRAEHDVVQLALLIAKRVLHRELAIDENALTAIARVAFERLTRAESYRVVVDPRFAAAITEALPRSLSARVEIVPDPGCQPGALMIHTAEGVVDASIDAQLEEINRGLADRMAPGRTSKAGAK